MLVGLVLGYAAGFSGEEGEPAGGRLFFPPERAVLLSSGFDVIWKGETAPLEINGKQREWEPFEPPIHVARVRLSPGVHELRIGGQRRRVVVAMNEQEHDGPADWPLLRSHEMSATPNRCGDCHQTARQSDRVAVGELQSPRACLECHKRADFEATHSHPLEPIQHCEACHELHASPRKGLLKAPAKELCTGCHDS